MKKNTCFGQLLYVTVLFLMCSSVMTLLAQEEEDRITVIWDGVCPVGTTPRSDGTGCRPINSGAGLIWTPDYFPQNPILSGSFAINQENENGNDSCAKKVGNPITLSNGNKYQYEVDYEFANSNLPLKVARSYNSKSSYAHYFGNNWSTNLAPILSFRTTHYLTQRTADQVTIRYGDGAVQRFFSVPDENIWIKEIGSTRAKLHKGDNGYWLYQENDLNYIFKPNGRIFQVSDEYGNRLDYTYNSQNRLDQVKRNETDALSFHYHSNGYISKVDLPDSKTLHYTYVNNKLDKVTYQDGTVRRYVYVGNNLIKLIDERGTLYAQWSYDSNGDANSSWHGNNQEKVTISYSQSGTQYIREETNPLGKKTKYTFERKGGKKRVVKVEGAQKGSCLAANQAYTYDAFGYQDKITDWQGIVTDYDYDGHGRLLKKVKALGKPEARTTTYTYWFNTNKITQMKSPLVEVNTEYDDMGRPILIERINKASYGVANQKQITTISYEFFSNGLMKKRMVDASRTDTNDITTTEYNNKGHLIKVTNALGHVTTFSNYDNNGRVRRITAPSGQITDLIYDTRGRLTKRKALNGTTARVTTYTYDNVGLMKKVTQPDGSDYDFVYDASRRLIKVTDANDKNKSYAYDAASNITSERINELVQELEYTFTCCGPFGEPIVHSQWVTTENLFSSHASEYDALSRLTKIIGGNNQTEQFAYRKDNLLAWEKDGLGKATHYYYNALKQLIRTRDAQGKSTYYYYNTEGDLRAVRDPDARYTYYDRDGFGQVWRLRSPDTGYTYYEYDTAGNLKKETKANGLVTSYTYDALNRIKTSAANGMSQAFTYDSVRKGHLYQVSNSSGYSRFWHNGFGELTRRYDNINGVGHNSYWYYDNMGRVKQLRTPDGRRVYYSYNNTGGIATVKTRLGSGTLYNVVTNAQYKPFGPVSEFTYGNGEKRLYERDLSYRLSGLGSGNYLANDYTFDANNNVKNINDVTSANQDRNHNYDSLQRLLSHTGPDGSYSYTFDSNGNRKTSKRNGVTTTNYFTSGTNKLYKSGNTNYSLDAAGNTKQIGGRVFTYNGENRLSRVKNGSSIVDYKYNAFGERVYKQKGSTKSYYVYGQGGQLLYEKEGTIKKSYIYFGNEIVAYVRNNVIYYVHSDHLGRPQVLTNSSKAKVWNAQNNAYGRTLTKGSSLGFNVGFPGQYWDADTNLFYNYFRDYDPSIGRYIQSDPIGLLGGTNTYAYVSSNPSNYVDSLGLFEVWAARVQTGSGIGSQYHFEFSPISKDASRLALKLTQIGRKIDRVTQGINLLHDSLTGKKVGPKNIDSWKEEKKCGNLDEQLKKDFEQRFGKGYKSLNRADAESFLNDSAIKYRKQWGSFYSRDVSSILNLADARADAQNNPQDLKE